MTTIAAVPALAQPRPRRRPAIARKSVRLELTRRGRALRTLLVLAVLLVLAATAMIFSGAPSALADWVGGPQYVSVTVQPGDTLWGYARTYAPEGMDPRDYVLQIQQANDLPTSRVTAGTQLDLPVAEGAAR